MDLRGISRMLLLWGSYGRKHKEPWANDRGASVGRAFVAIARTCAHGLGMGLSVRSRLLERVRFGTQRGCNGLERRMKWSRNHRSLHSRAMISADGERKKKSAEVTSPPRK